MNSSKIITILALLLMLGTSYAFDSSNYNYVKDITINTASLDLNNDVSVQRFLIDINSSNTGFWTNVASTGSGVTFANDALDTNYDFEWDTWNYSGNQAYAWVEYTGRVVQSQDVTFKLLYDGSEGDLNNPTGVWDANYIAVYHFSQDSGTIFDSTSNSIDSTTISLTEQGGTGGKIGGLIDCEAGSSNRVVMNYNAAMETNTPSLQMWANPESNVLDRRIFSRNNSGQSERPYYISSDGDNPPSNYEYVLEKSDGSFVRAEFANLSTGSFQLITGTYDGSNLRIYKNASLEDDDAQASLTLHSGSYGWAFCSAADASNNLFDGKIDEARIINRGLTSDEVLVDYATQNNASGFLTLAPQQQNAGITADFDYNINKYAGEINFTDVSTAAGATINDWNWFVNGSIESTDQNFDYSTTQLQDLNVCIQVSDSTIPISDMSCETFNSGDWEAPSTTLTITPGSTNQTLLQFSCTDNNSGCDRLFYSIDGGSDNNVDISSGSFNVNILGTGDKNVVYYSRDKGYVVTPNNESPNTDTWTKYGYVRLELTDEIDARILDGFSITLDSNTLTTNASGVVVYDLSNFGSTTTGYNITASGTNYTERVYYYNLNQFSAIDQNIVLIEDSNAVSISFTFYESDGTTLLSNAQVSLFNYNTSGWNKLAEKRLTDASAKTTFFMNPNDENYSFSIVASDGDTFDYNAMILNVLYPRNELTGNQISEEWFLSVGGLAAQDFNNLTAAQPISIYSDTTGSYTITAGDVNGNFFERKYYVNFVGGTSTANLQPYLVPKSGSISTTIKAVSGYTLLPLEDVSIRIYKLLPSTGRTLVEQVVTDGKGEAFVSLSENDDYEFEVYWEGSLQFTQNVTATSTTIFVRISNLDVIRTPLAVGAITIEFSPMRGKLVTFDDALTQIIKTQDQNIDLNVQAITIWVVNTDVNGTYGNDVNLFSVSVTPDSSGTTTNTFDLNAITQILNSVSYDNNGLLIVNVSVQTDQGTYFNQFTYDPVRGTDFYRTFAYDIRPTFGCPRTLNPNIPCPIMLLIALFISTIATAGFAFETGLTGLEGLAGVFLLILGIFAYFTWVPPILYGGLVVVIILIGLALAGRNRV